MGKQRTWADSGQLGSDMGALPAGKRAFLLALLLVLLAQLLQTAECYRAAYAAICTNVKDEGTYLVEFILYHRWIGFGKVYVMDYNSSRPHYNLKLLQPFIRTGLVEYHYDADPRHHASVPGKYFAEYSQGTAFQRCIDFAHRDHMWMAFIDADEYIILRSLDGSRPNITSFLTPYESYNGLSINMRVFGSSGHLRRPTVATLEAYTQCASPDASSSTFVKTIAKMTKVLAVGGNPHEFIYLNGGKAVNEMGATTQGAQSAPVSWGEIVLHHYVTRSLEEFLEKIDRGPGGSRTKRNLDWFRSYDGNATEVCTEGISLWQTCCAEQFKYYTRPFGGRGRRRRGGLRGEPLEVFSDRLSGASSPRSFALAKMEDGTFTELTACDTCGTLWKREFKGPTESLSIVAKRLKREAHLTDPPSGHRVVFWKCHTCGADHIDDSWADLLAAVGVRDNAASTPATGPPRNNPFQHPQQSPPQLLRPPVPQR
ncbi:hypothetical protein TSOC_005448 [Tetrabaena socialis]|uniref:Glycosyltransferase family 92 protein n=1 Tax=Tetrabaena socialis TaxID=47790 RepID=A0A2J8A671_9CHLO|nr:hypothetical protein TSOC_005448 [Tetrabaena socialis]|eukprot:PNH08026.1 hypothetical protein TSOC_005448 [Tetrabaena socialis]